MIVTAGVLGRPSGKMVVGISANDLIIATAPSDCLVVCDMAVGEMMCEDGVHMNDMDEVLVES